MFKIKTKYFSIINIIKLISLELYLLLNLPIVNPGYDSIFVTIYKNANINQHY